MIVHDNHYIVIRKGLDDFVMDLQSSFIDQIWICKKSVRSYNLRTKLLNNICKFWN